MIGWGWAWHHELSKARSELSAEVNAAVDNTSFDKSWHENEIQ